MKAVPHSAMPVEVYKIHGLKSAKDYNVLELQEWGGRRLSVSRSVAYNSNREPQVEINLITSDKDNQADALRITEWGMHDGRPRFLVKDLFGYINILTERKFRETYHLLDEEVSV